MVNQKFKVFAFTFLILSLALLPPTNFAFAASELIVPTGEEYIVESGNDKFNTVKIMPNASLIIPSGVTLTVNQNEPYTQDDGLDVFPNAILTIENGGRLVVNGNTQNKGEIFIDGSYGHFGYPEAGGFILNSLGHIYERCGSLDATSTYKIRNPIEAPACEDGTNKFFETDLTVEEGDTFVVAKEDVLYLSGETTIRGKLVNFGIIDNLTIMTLDGGEIENAGTIFNICNNFGISGIAGSGGDQNVGTVLPQPCLQPKAVNDDYIMDEDEILPVSLPGVLLNDEDVNLTGILESINPTIPANGVVSDFLLDGSFTYTPNPDFSGTDSFQYDVRDGYGVTDTATVTIEVKPVDDPPIAIDDFYSTSENTILIIDVPGVLQNDVDVNNVGLTASVTITPTNPEFGTLEFDDVGSFTYTPNDQFFGEDSFEYEITDGNGNIGLAPATVTIEISEEDPPIAIDDFYSTREGEELIIDAPGVLQNDDDVNNVGLTASNISNPASGILEFQSNGSFVYTSSDTFLGTDSFEYQITDGHGNIGLVPATVTIEVIEVTDVPIAIDDFYSTSENTILIIDVPGVLQNDVDVNNVGLTASVTITPTNPEFGTLEFDDVGSFTYTPNDQFFGEDSFEYEITDRFGGADTATVTIEITKVIDDSLQEQKINKIIELDNLSDEASKKHTEDEIKKAIKDLTKSVESKKWEDNGNYLIKNEGSDVFNKQQKGVKHIIHILDEDKEPDEFLSKIISIALDLVDIDNKLATNEFIIAEESPNSEQKCLDDAEKEYEKSDSELEKGKYDKAIDHLGHLWEKSLKCQGINIESSGHGPGR